MQLLARIAKTAFWTLSGCAYLLAFWCTLALAFDLRLLPFNIAIPRESKEAIFTSYLCFLTSAALLPLVFYFKRSRLYLWAGLGVWGFWLLWFFAFPVY